jgi:hypothetical protein
MMPRGVDGFVSPDELLGVNVSVYEVRLSGNGIPRWPPSATEPLVCHALHAIALFDIPPCLKAGDSCS